jgi:hypothetical protein
MRSGAWISSSLMLGPVRSLPIEEAIPDWLATLEVNLIVPTTVRKRHSHLKRRGAGKIIPSAGDCTEACLGAAYACSKPVYGC